MAFRDMLTRVLQRTFDISSPQARAFFTGQDMIDGAKIVSTETAWRESVWVRKCITRKASNLAKLNFELMRGTKVLPSHWLYDFLKHPNPYYSTNALWDLTVSILDLYGECFWLMVPNSIKPERMEFIHPRMISAVLSASRLDLIGWRLSMPSGKSPIADPADIVHFKYPNPFNRFRGAAPMESVNLSTSNDLAAQKWNLGFFQRGAIPAGVLITDKVVTPEKAADILDTFEARHRDPHRPAFLHGGVDYKETQAKQREMEFMGGRRMNREEILAAFGVPPVVVGLLEYAAWATAREQRRIFWEETMLPLGWLIADTIDRHIVRDDTLIGRFNTEGIADLRENLTEKLEAAKSFHAMGVPWIVIDKKLQIGLDKFEGDDIGFIPTNERPMEQAIAPPEPKLVPAPATAAPAKAAAFPMPVKLIAASTPQEDVRNRIEAAVVKSLPATQRESPITPEQWHEITVLLDQMKQKIAATSEKYYADAAAIGTKQGQDAMSIDMSVSYKEEIDAFIAQKVLQIQDIEDTTKEKIKDIIHDAIEQGLTVDDVAKQLREDYNFGPDRAETIARTEMASTVNGARDLVFQAEGAEATEWLSARDDRVRETHAEEDGSVEPIGEPFPITGCLFPGDPNGAPEEIINCRCIALPAELVAPSSTDTTTELEASAMCRACGTVFTPRMFECKDASGNPTRTVPSRFCDVCLEKRDAVVTKVIDSYAHLEHQFSRAVSKHFFRERSAILKIILGGK